MLEQRLYRDATFLTGWSGRPRAGAVLVRGERIVALGEPDELLAHTTGPVEQVSLGGGCAVPGLVDAHIHTGNLAVELTALDLRGTTTLDEALGRVRDYAATTPEDGWVIGGRWDPNLWEGPAQPDRHMLDVAAGGRPVALPSVDGHTVWASTAALAMAGITAATPDRTGGRIERDADGEPTGLLREQAYLPLMPWLRGDQGPDLDEQLLAVQERLLTAGLTGVHCFDGEEVRASYLRLRERGDLRIRVHKAIPATALDLAIDEGRATGDGDAWLRTGPVKLFSDGALGSRTCHMTHPFQGEGDNHGIEVIPYPELEALVRRAVGAGIAVATHAIGDRANQLVLDAYEAVQDTGYAAPTRPGGPLRMRIEHAQHLRPEDVRRAARLGVVPSMQPTHCTTDTHLVDRLLGDQHVASYAWRSFLDAGAVLALGSDAPVEPADPLFGIHAAVTRQRRGDAEGDGWQPHERLTVEQALAGFAAGAAWASGEEHLRGQLRPGMLADLTVLGEDPTSVAPHTLHQLPVTGTVVGGQQHHRTT